MTQEPSEVTDSQSLSDIEYVRLLWPDNEPKEQSNHTSIPILEYITCMKRTSYHHKEVHELLDDLQKD